MAYKDKSNINTLIIITISRFNYLNFLYVIKLALKSRLIYAIRYIKLIKSSSFFVV
jgi:hypothetical protein